MTDDEAKAVIQEAVIAIAKQRGNDAETPVITGWVIAYEAVTTAQYQDGYYGGGTITPDGQSPALSRGLAMNSADFYNPSHWTAEDGDA